MRLRRLDVYLQDGLKAHYKIKEHKNLIRTKDSLLVPHKSKYDFFKKKLKYKKFRWGIYLPRAIESISYILTFPDLR